MSVVKSIAINKHRFIEKVEVFTGKSGIGILS